MPYIDPMGYDFFGGKPDTSWSIIRSTVNTLVLTGCGKNSPVMKIDVEDGI